MSQPSQSHYGRPNQPGPYTYAGNSTGFPFQHQQPPPQRYFTPSQGKFSPGNTCAKLTFADNQPPNSQYPPQNTPSAFYNATQGPASSNPVPQQTHIMPGTKLPLGGPPPQAHRPQSTYENPQELATSMYDSPVDGRQASNPSHHPPPHHQQGSGEYSPSVYSGDGYISPQQAYGAPISQQPQHAQGYNAYHGGPPEHQAPHSPGAGPTSSPAPYPILGQGGPPQSAPGGGYGQGRPQYAPPLIPQGASQPQAGGPADYYRQNTGGPGNELFMGPSGR